jgi:hypothetical protein
MLWLTIILPLPFLGIIMYFTFAGRRVPKRYVRKINKTLGEMNACFLSFHPMRYSFSLL